MDECKVCANADNEYCFACDNGNQFKPTTNADRIRAMTDAELAEWLERIRLCCTTELCGRSCPLSEICYSNAEAPKETLDWLRQEAE